ncbi:sodium-independent sulfate anion [Nesidiocoris tenuis]|uniref:Sodium-independent sulfate anion n=1 Tax=Nesidiocoris tenuis TaxID=355587 RepID=A0ABN7BFZ4_9HEMI|nr:sodium-independent sulfate anion [Nesidiocoris tenuis]
MGICDRLGKFFRRTVPLANKLRSYSRQDALGDAIAGLTISLAMIPQSIAYAALANLEPQYGLNSAFAGCLVYVVFGTVKEVVIGPSSLMSLLTLEFTYRLNVDFAILLTFLAGFLQMVIALLKLGVLLGYISTPVISGFTSASSIIIVGSQLKGMLGIQFKSSGFVDSLVGLKKNIHQQRDGDTILGICCLIGLFILKAAKENLAERYSKYPWLKTALVTLGTARNALVVFASSCVAWYYQSNDMTVPFITTRATESGIPLPRIPPLSTTFQNRTLSFTDMIDELGTGPMTVAIVGVLINVAIAKKFADGPVDVQQEIATLSLCNMFGSLFQSIPTSGAFTRSALIGASGVRSTFASLYSAILSLLAIQFLGPHIHLIPRASLSAMLIAAVVVLIDWETPRRVWKRSKIEFLAVVATLLGCLLIRIDLGLLCGVAVGIARLTYKWARPSITVDRVQSDFGMCVVVKPDISLHFPSAEYFSQFLLKEARKEISGTPIIIDCECVVDSDYTVATTLNLLQEIFEKTGHKLVLTNVPPLCKKKWKMGKIRETLISPPGEAFYAAFGKKIDSTENDETFQLIGT